MKYGNEKWNIKDVGECEVNDGDGEWKGKGIDWKCKRDDSECEELGR